LEELKMLPRFRCRLSEPRARHAKAAGLAAGMNGGYYGCLAATKGACKNKTLVRRTVAEKVILDAVKDELANPDHVADVLQRVEEEIAKLRADLPDNLKLKEAELSAEQRRLANFVDFTGEGRGSQALAKALVETERRVETLTDEVEGTHAQPRGSVQDAADRMDQGSARAPARRAGAAHSAVGSDA
jgi:hypothetical protein